MPLDDHLGTGKNVDLPVLEPIQDAFQLATLSYRVSIEPFDACFRKAERQLLLDFLRSYAAEEQSFARALRTQWGAYAGEPAQMASKVSRPFVVGQADVTVGTLEHVAAGSTLSKRIEAPAIEKENHLLASR